MTAHVLVTGAPGNVGTPLVRELLASLQAADRRNAQVKAALATERERWARLKATAQDADRMGHTIDVVSHMRAIEADTPSVPVLLLTACDDRVAKDLFTQGLRGYVQKPFYLNDLIRRVRNEVEAV